MLDAGPLVEVLSARAENVNDNVDGIRDCLNSLPGGGLAKTSAIWLLVLALPPSCFDIVYQMMKVDWSLESIDEGCQNSADMMFSSALGASLLFLLVLVLEIVDSQKLVGKKLDSVVLAPMVSNALGSVIRFVLAKENYGQLLVDPGEAVYGVLLGGMLSFTLLAVALLTLVVLSKSLHVLSALINNINELIHPPVGLNETTLQSLGQVRPIENFTQVSDIELSISTTLPQDEMRLGDIVNNV